MTATVVSSAAGALILVLVAAVPASPQSATPPRATASQPAARRIPVGTAVVSGTVVSTETGRPVRNVRITLNGTAGAPPAGRGVEPPTPQSPGPPTMSLSRTTFTDAQGQFTFARVAAGRYAVTASRDGYLATSYGRPRANGGAFPALEVAEGETRRIALALDRGGVIAGHLTDDDGEPVRNAQVQVWRRDRSNGIQRLQPQNSVSTNDRGAFRFFALPPGSYLVSATPRNSDGPATQLADILVVEEAIASGRVQAPAAAGAPAFVLAPAPVAIRDGSGPIAARALPNPAYLPVFYPGVLDPSAATTVQITGNGAHEGLDIPLQFARAAIVRGVIVPPPGQGGVVQVSLANMNPLAAASMFATGVNPEDGSFVFNNVAPGRYAVMAQSQEGATRVVDSGRVVLDGKPLPADMRVLVMRPSSGGLDERSRMWAMAEIVTTSEAIVDVQLSLSPARAVAGRVEFDMASPPDLERSPLTLTLQPVPDAITSRLNYSTSQVRVASDGTFIFQGVVPGRYLLRAPGNLQSVVLGGEDLLDLPLEVRGDRDITGLLVTATDKNSEITGTITSAAGEPAGNHLVLVAPVDDRYWVAGSRRIQLSTTGPYGRYTTRLPPGDYVIVALLDLDNGAQYDREFLASVVDAGAKVTLSEGGSVTKDLRIR